MIPRSWDYPRKNRCFYYLYIKYRSTSLYYVSHGSCYRYIVSFAISVCTVIPSYTSISLSGNKLKLSLNKRPLASILSETISLPYSESLEPTKANVSRSLGQDPVSLTVTAPTACVVEDKIRALFWMWIIWGRRICMIAMVWRGKKI